MLRIINVWRQIQSKGNPSIFNKLNVVGREKPVGPIWTEPLPPTRIDLIDVRDYVARIERYLTSLTWKFNQQCLDKSIRYTSIANILFATKNLKTMF